MQARPKCPRRSEDGRTRHRPDSRSADARAKAEALPVTVPAGATSMVVKFRYYNASNNWYWAIDDLRVS